MTVQREDTTVLAWTDFIDRVEQLCARRAADEIDDTFLFTQVESTYSTGDPGQVDADITYRPTAGARYWLGPGQLLVVGAWKRPAEGVVAALQAVGIAGAAAAGVTATPGDQSGLWVGRHKLAAMALRVQDGVVGYGLALNVNCDLTAFDTIAACNGKQKATSLEHAAGKAVDFKAVADAAATAASSQGG